MLPPIDDERLAPAEISIDDVEPEDDNPTAILSEPLLVLAATPDFTSICPLDALAPAAADCKVKSPELDAVPSPNLN